MSFSEFEFHAQNIGILSIHLMVCSCRSNARLLSMFWFVYLIVKHVVNTHNRLKTVYLS